MKQKKTIFLTILVFIIFFILAIVGIKRDTQLIYLNGTNGKNTIKSKNTAYKNDKKNNDNIQTKGKEKGNNKKQTQSISNNTKYYKGISYFLIAIICLSIALGITLFLILFLLIFIIKKKKFKKNMATETQN